MVPARLGAPPSRLVDDLARVIVSERGLTRDAPEQNRRFVAALVDVTEAAFEQYGEGVPPEERRTLSWWRHSAGDAARQ
jgi:hypothetical protein